MVLSFLWQIWAAHCRGEMLLTAEALVCKHVCIQASQCACHSRAHHSLCPRLSRDSAVGKQVLHGPMPLVITIRGSDMSGFVSQQLP